jgi:hypothetical protein
MTEQRWTTSGPDELRIAPVPTPPAFFSTASWSASTSS